MPGVLNRAVYGTLAILAATGVFACSSGLAMTWDGAYQFAYGLMEQKPYWYGTRFHSWVLWEPFVGLSHWTHHYLTLQFAYGLPFLVAPAVALLVSWWVVRAHAPGLIVWAAFGIAVAPLPGQVFVINDSIFQSHLFWPVFLAPLRR